MSARGLDGGTDPAGAATVSGAIAFTVNGRSVSVTAPPLRRLADALRDDLGLTGTKVGCNAGDCGACTVLLDSAQVCSCMVSLAQAAGRSVETVEGLAQNGRLNRLQRAFLRHGAAQCGACHARHADRRDRGFTRLPAPQRGTGDGRSRRRPLPLHRLSQDRGSGARRGGRCAATPDHAPRPARPSAPGLPSSTACPSSPVRSAMVPTPCRRMRSGSGSSARPMPRRGSCSATSR